MFPFRNIKQYSCTIYSFYPFLPVGHKKLIHVKVYALWGFIFEIMYKKLYELNTHIVWGG